MILWLLHFKESNGKTESDRDESLKPPPLVLQRTGAYIAFSGEMSYN